jgi:hypothetical protein
MPRKRKGGNLFKLKQRKQKALKGGSIQRYHAGPIAKAKWMYGGSLEDGTDDTADYGNEDNPTMPTQKIELVLPKAPKPSLRDTGIQLASVASPEFAAVNGVSNMLWQHLPGGDSNDMWDSVSDGFNSAGKAIGNFFTGKKEDPVWEYDSWKDYICGNLTPAYPWGDTAHTTMLLSRLYNMLSPLKLVTGKYTNTATMVGIFGWTRRGEASKLGISEAEGLQILKWLALDKQVNGSSWTSSAMNCNKFLYSPQRETFLDSIPGRIATLQSQLQATQTKYNTGKQSYFNNLKQSNPATYYAMKKSNSSLFN